MSDLNDPRVFFAAERTLLAWNRTSLALMAFGFVIERFGLFGKMLEQGAAPSKLHSPSLWIGIAFIVMGALVCVVSVQQYRALLVTLKPIEIPEGHRVNMGVWINLAVAFLGAALSLYLVAAP